MRMARAVGVRAVGIASVLGDPDELRAAGADEVAPIGRRLGRRAPSPAAGRRERRRPAMSRAGARRAIVLADGDVAGPGGARRGLAGLGRRRRRSSSRPTAAPATRPRSACRIDRWVGDGDSIDAGGARRAARRPASRSTSSPADKDESDTELAVRAGDRRRRATRSRSSARSAAARLDHALANVALLAHPALGGRARPCCSTRRPGRLVRLRPDGGPVDAAAGRPGRRPRLAHPVRRRRRRASRPTASATRSATRRSSSGRRAACRTSGAPRDASCRRSGRGAILVIETPATLSR